MSLGATPLPVFGGVGLPRFDALRRGAVVIVATLAWRVATAALDVSWFVWWAVLDLNQRPTD